jgi:S1-C subfamily serine protease
MRFCRRVLALALAGLIVGCAEPAPDVSAPRDIRDGTSIDALPEAPDELRAEGVERALREATLRVRTRGCLGLATGSGFAVSKQVVATNRHVIENDAGVQVSSWDGHTWATDLVAAAVFGDLALVQVDGTLPVALDFRMTYASGDDVIVVGYPGGRALTFSHGSIVDDVSGAVFGQPGRVLRVEARAEPGNSGGPVVNMDGDLVGVVFAIEPASGYALAMTASTLLSAAESQSFRLVDPAC